MMKNFLLPHLLFKANRKNGFMPSAEKRLNETKLNLNSVDVSALRTDTYIIKNLMQTVHVLENL